MDLKQYLPTLKQFAHGLVAAVIGGVSGALGQYTTDAHLTACSATIVALKDCLYDMRGPAISGAILAVLLYLKTFPWGGAPRRTDDTAKTQDPNV